MDTPNNYLGDNDSGEEVTVKAMLKLYRQNMDAFSLNQWHQFNQLMPHDRIEMLFHMIINTNKVLMHVHSLVKPDEVVIKGMINPQREN